MSRFLLDSNVFIEASARYYSFEICPGFWKSLLELHSAGLVCSIDRIRSELLVPDDQIADWIKLEVPDGFFKETKDQAVVDAFSDMVQWVYSQDQFVDAAKSEFASVADGWLIAFAAASSSEIVVVTHEEYAPDVKKKVPMPNVCLEFNVNYCNTFEMLQRVGEKFVRKHRSI